MYWIGADEMLHVSPFYMGLDDRTTLHTVTVEYLNKSKR
jgi:hypothetical protein